MTEALEKIIETNILLSGLGFESGGLAAAHAIHDGLTILEGTHKYFHGEKVAFGTIAQLTLENAPMEEIEEVLDCCLSIGLPVCLEDIGVDHITEEELYQVAEKACIPEESIDAMPFPITCLLYTSNRRKSIYGRYQLTVMDDAKRRGIPNILGKMCIRDSGCPVLHRLQALP